MRGGLRIMGGREATQPIVKQPYYLKPMPANPYLGSQYDHSSVVNGGYQRGFVFKHIHHLYRYRYNLFPVGQTTGMYGRNKWAKHVHWLEVSTIERMRVQILGEEAIPMFWLSIAVFAFTFFHVYRLATQHPDATMYFATGPFTKPFVKMTRFSEVHPMHKPIPYKYFQRAPEWFTWDAYRELVKLEVIANDPFLEQLKKEGRVDNVKVNNGWIKWVGPYHNTPPVDKPLEGYMSFINTGPHMNDTKSWKWRDMFWDKCITGGDKFCI